MNGILILINTLLISSVKSADDHIYFIPNLTCIHHADCPNQDTQFCLKSRNTCSYRLQPGSNCSSGAECMSNACELGICTFIIPKSLSPGSICIETVDCLEIPAFAGYGQMYSGIQCESSENTAIKSVRKPVKICALVRKLSNPNAQSNWCAYFILTSIALFVLVIVYIIIRNKRQKAKRYFAITEDEFSEVGSDDIIFDGQSVETIA